MTNEPMRPENQNSQKPDAQAHSPISKADPGVPPPILDTSFVKRQWLDIPYARQSETQKLDIFLPDEGEGPFPVIFVIHGGAWKICDKRDEQLLPMLKGIYRGYAVVSINYRLSQEAIFPAQIFDCKSALRFIKAHAYTYHLDKTRIALWGGSAGGHLAALLATSEGVRELEDFSTGNETENTRVSAVVDWFGPTYSFLEMDAMLAETGNGPCDHSLPESPESCLLGAQITTVPELVWKASPAAYIHPDVPYFLIQHGYHDPVVPVQQSIKFAAALEQIAGKEKVHLDVFMNHIVHADPYFESDENLEIVYAFLDKYLKK
ncbi:MAG TPA: alpha/beta hydrolase [Anaerolineaceae bacterium]|nr:alpha/beta hydrolase [Anaerolineaceae bacterium]HOT24819.1 alpha/beta hydrolase [Anaerolineaceae bacterium]HQH57588.1 alpha/beta hydrolase [Anaerolineaceae bacterium]HQK03146.1 alpha/beta hydrolase [Anaerolineaceae bacterium]HQL28414.1 alpha/beta hydrolase [Anaerolineaceae bacterium]